MSERFVVVLDGATAPAEMEVAILRRRGGMLDRYGRFWSDLVDRLDKARPA